MHDGAPPRDRAGGSAGPPPGARGAAAAPGREPNDPRPLDLQAIARDWITLWQSELTAAAADRELQETWQTLAALWAGAAGAMLQGLPRGGPDGRGFAARPAGAR